MMKKQQQQKEQQQQQQQQPQQQQQQIPTLQRSNILQQDKMSSLQSKCPKLPPLDYTESKTKRNKTDEYLGKVGYLEGPGKVGYILEDPKRCIEEAIWRRRGVCPTNPHLGNKIKSEKLMKGLKNDSDHAGA